MSIKIGDKIRYIAIRKMGKLLVRANSLRLRIGAFWSIPRVLD